MLCTCSLSLVVAGNGLLDQGLVIKAEHDGCESMLPVMFVNASSVVQCGVSFVGIDKFLHSRSPK